MLSSSLRMWLSWCSILWLAQSSFQASVLGERSLTALSNDAMAKLLTTPDPVKNIDPRNPSSHLSKILIPRAPDTQNNTFVRNYLISTLKGLNWHVETDEFEADTPVGRKKFANVIATKDPDAPRRLILSAHFDSKYFPSYPMNQVRLLHAVIQYSLTCLQFVGATDSAAPCAMMLDAAEALNPLLEARMKRIKNGSQLDDEDEDVGDLTLQLVFFDGEEAFKDWTDTDSIYGARHLAEKWDTTYISPHTKRRLMNDVTTELAAIEHLILLDLLGAKQPLIRSSFIDTAWMFDHMVAVEERLGTNGAFAYDEEQSMAPGKWTSYFVKRNKDIFHMGGIGDDHLPFLNRGVSILHIIANPFPRVWHSSKDDATALDIPTMRRWNLILRVFLAEYFELEPKGSKSRSLNDPEEEEADRYVARSVSELSL
ncbi:glutaminyl-peptide cyclotransferase-like protein [Coprinopsis marcescibilis]|uniref:Peptide hydrolase n=1 Tax=Coprinopsis marcescibilis TaxID=230819 RepID=A0A5C3LC67_COPMA|nr:glutaminyl-peptide cyclotransferase-like protein [Coprinopsis marcescibilis]